tara:strand:+ start:637 stop:834 length:198 start_codon:yes stop_codon:yes gene_type:complete
MIRTKLPKIDPKKLEEELKELIDKSRQYANRQTLEELEKEKAYLKYRLREVKEKIEHKLTEHKIN